MINFVLLCLKICIFTQAFKTKARKQHCHAQTLRHALLLVLQLLIYLRLIKSVDCYNNNNHFIESQQWSVVVQRFHYTQLMLGPKQKS